MYVYGFINERFFVNQVIGPIFLTHFFVLQQMLLLCCLNLLVCSDGKMYYLKDISADFIHFKTLLIFYLLILQFCKIRLLHLVQIS